MKLFFFIFIFSQLLNFLVVFADKVKKDSGDLNSIRWEKVEENNRKPFRWEIYKNKIPINLESDFEKDYLERADFPDKNHYSLNIHPVYQKYTFVISTKKVFLMFLF